MDGWVTYAIVFSCSYIVGFAGDMTRVTHLDDCSHWLSVDVRELYYTLKLRSAGFYLIPLSPISVEIGGDSSPIPGTPPPPQRTSPII